MLQSRKMKRGWGIKAHIVLQVGLAAIEEQHPAGLVVAVLTAEVKRREPASVLDVEVCF